MSIRPGGAWWAVAIALVAIVAMAFAAPWIGGPSVPNPNTNPGNGSPPVSGLGTSSGGDPTIAVAPSQGPVGATYTVSGSGFTDSAAANLTFDSVLQTPTGGSICTFTGTTITTNATGAFVCTFHVPSETAGTYDIVAEDETTKSLTSAQSFLVTSLGIVVSPLVGPLGTSVTVSGTGFSVSSTLTSLVLDTVTISSCSPGSLTTGSSGAFGCTFKVPSSTSGTAVVATDVGGQSASGTFTVTIPTVALSPSQGPVGAAYTATGSGFTDSSPVTIAFNGILQDPTGCSPGTGSGTTITTDASGAFACTFKVPSEGSGAYSVVGTDVATGTTAATQTFTVTTLAITLTPSQGPSGASVTVAGSGFTPGATITVSIGSGAAITACGATVSTGGEFSCPVIVTSTTPAIYSLKATGSDGSFDNASASFTVTTTSITLSPTLGPSGESVLVSGSGFTPTATITTTVSAGATIGGCGVAVATGGTFGCTVTIASTTAAGYAVTATGSDGSFDRATAVFTVTTPSISLSPSQGPTGTSVTISGTGFSPGVMVSTTIAVGATIGGCGATVMGTGAFSCAVTVTAGSPAAYSITATGTDGSFDSATASFTVTGLSLSLAPALGPSGVTATASGAGFTPGKTITTTISDGASITTCDATVSGSGTFSCSVTISGTASSTAYTVKATGSDGSFDNATTGFTITLPTITLSPTEGPSGASVAVAGSGFTPGKSITTSIGGGPSIGACGASVDGTGSFGCTVTITGTASGSPYTVTATGSDGSFDSATAGFTITSLSIGVSPSEGPIGATVTVSGTGFSVTSTLSSLVLGGQTISSCNPGSLTTGSTGAFSCTFKVPSGASGTTVTATDSGGQSTSGSFTVTTPSITVSPSQGPVGATVTVSGTGFSVSSTLSSLVLDGVTISSCATGSMMTSSSGGLSCGFAVPPSTSGTSVVVTDSGGETATGTFSVTSQSITLSASQGPSGTSVTVSGTGFTPSATITTSISGGAAIGTCGSSVSGTGGFSCSVKITGTASSTAYTVTATGSDGSFDSATASFTITTPTIALSPNEGPVGATYTVTGSGFTVSSPATVGFNGILQDPTGCTAGTASGTTITTNTTGGFACTFKVPSVAAASYNVVGTDVAATTTVTETFTVTTPAITLTPTQGPSGASVTIAGSGFTPAATIATSITSGATVGLCPATVSSSGTFSCDVTITGTASSTEYTVTVTGSDGSFDSATASFKITSQSITLSATQGPSGATVTVTGSGFTPLATVAVTISGGASVSTCGATVDGTGAFSCGVTVTGTASSTAYTVTATGSDGSFDSATALFTITTPTITLSASEGPSGATVTVSGTGFTPEVTVGTTISTGASITDCGVTVATGGTFSCSVTITSSVTAGYVVTAEGTDGSFDSATAPFTITTPAITITPTQGPSGTSATVSGTGFSPGKTIATTISSGASVTPCGATVSGTGTFSCTVKITGASSSTAYAVTATGSDGEFDSASGSFTITGTSIVLSPVQGPTGTSVTVTGGGFAPDVAITTTITGGATIGTCGAVASGTGTFSCSVTITGTASTTPYTVKATGSDGSFDNATATFTITALAITVSPGEGPVGATVTVSGTGFSVTSTLSSLELDGVGITSCTTGSLATGSTGEFSCTFAVPSGTAGTTVTATDVGGGTASGTFTVTTPDISVSPTQGPVGATVTVSGTGFSVTSTLSSLELDGVAITGCTTGSLATSSSGTFSCTFAVPSETSGTTVTATDAGGRAATGTFTVTSQSITLSPTQGPSGVSTTVTGSGFTIGAVITTTINNGASIATCGATASGAGGFSCSVKVTGASSSTPYIVTATGSDGSFDSATASFTITAPSITLSPSQGPVSATYAVTGSGFTVSSPATVGFNGILQDPTGCTAGTASGTTITTNSTGGFECMFKVPSATAAAYNVVGTDVATAATVIETFTVTAPAITLTPSQGPSGVSVTVTGTGFTPGVTAAVSIGSGATITACGASVAAGGTFSCDVTITGTASSTAYTVTATGSDGSFDSASAPFTITTHSITLSPAQGPSGASVTVTGTGFTPGATVALTISAGAGVSLCSATANGTGAFSCGVTVTGTASSTAYTVTATGSDGSFDSATALFTITTPTITLSASEGPSGATVTVSGTGFTPEVTVGTTISTGASITDCGVTVATGGTFSCSVTITSSVTAGYVVTAEGTDGSFDSATAPFTITALAISVSPGEGPVGATVTVSGTGFSVTSTLSSLELDGVGITSCTTGSLATGSTGEFSCTFKVPSEASGTTVTATDVGGQSASGTFTVTVPTITVSPGEGPVGATVTVSGTGFSVTSTLSSLELDGVGITSCTTGSLATSSSGTFSCGFAVPTETSGTTVAATDVGGQAAGGTFTVTTPAITVSPNEGPVGATVQVSGTGFSVSSTLTSLVLDEVSITDCTVGSLATSTSGTFSCTFAVPSEATGTTVTATDSGGQTADGSFEVTVPSVTLSRDEGPVGATSTLSGTGFTPSVVVTSSISAGATVSSCGASTSATGTFSCSITLNSGAATSYTVTAEGSDGSFDSATTTFTITTPAISVSPSQGPVGATVTVSGTGFSESSTLSSLVLGGETISSCSPGALTTGSTGEFSCTFKVPSGASGTTVTATDVGGQSASGTFTVTVPAISLSPSEGPVGATYTVTGSGFTVTSSVTVSFNGILQSPTGCTAGSGSGTTITTNGTGGFACTFKVASEAAGPYDVVGTDVATGATTAAEGFTVTTPAITLAPTEGPTGASVTVTGTGFTPGATISTTIGGGATIGTCEASVAPAGTFSCSVTITGTVSATPYTVRATGSDGSFDNATATFTITSQSITLSPDQGPSGVSVTVTGAGFTPDVTITTTISGGASITGCGATVSGSGAFSCSVTISLASPGAYSVTATGSDGSFDASGAAFTVTSPSISLTPSQGPSGASATVTGTGFTPGAAITTTISSGASATDCGATVSPTGSFDCSVTISSVTLAGYVLTATGSDGSFDSANAPFTITSPAISIAPVQGPSGASVNVSGAGFTPGVTVALTISAGASITTCGSTVSDSGAFSCIVKVTGTASTTAYSVTAAGSDGSFDSASASFTITAPAITISPTEGPSGSSATLSGTGFTPGATVATTVSGGATVSACGATVSGTGIFSCTVTISGTASPTAYTVKATGSDGGFDNATALFTITPVAISLSPSEGPVGATYTVTGSGFTVTSSVTVSFNGILQSPTGCTAGSGSGTTITTNGTGGFACTFKVASEAAGPYDVVGTDVATGATTAAEGFTVTTPAITLAPTEGPTGASVTVTGTGFSVSSTLTSLVFDGVPVSSCTSGSLATSSSGAFDCGFAVPTETSGTSVIATDAGGSVATATFTVTVPSIALSPTQGPSGASVTVSGTGFTPGVTVTTTIGAGAAIGACGTSVSASGTFSCTVAISSSVAAGYVVTATGSDNGNDHASTAFTVTSPAIVLLPTEGPSGATVAVSGTGFTPEATVTITVSAGASISACGATVTGAGAFACSVTITGTASATAYTVTATGSDGAFDHATAAFTITTPSITLTPNAGPSGESVVVSGSGFTPGATIATSIASGASITNCGAAVSSTGTFSCSVTIAGAVSSTPYTVTVTGSDGTFDEATAGFTIKSQSITLSPDQGPSGVTVTVTGSGFTDGVTISTAITSGAGITSCEATVSGSGGFSCSVTITGTPSATAYSVTATGSDGGFDSASAAFTITASEITLLPTQGPSGASVTVSGTGFTPAVTVATSISSGATVSACGTVVSSSGSFSCLVTISAGIATGYTLSAEGSDGGFDSGTATYTVTTPSLSLSPTQGPSGVSLTASGTGFTPGETITTSVGAGAAVTGCGATVTSSGSFSCSVTISASSPAAFSLKATGADLGNDYASATFTVTQPTISLSPTQGPSGATTTVTGAGFTPGVMVTTTIGAGAALTVCGAATSGAGSFSCVVEVNGVASATAYALVATGSDGGFDSSTATFTITTPALALSPTQGPSGATVAVSGSGFTPGRTVALAISAGGTVSTCGAVVGGTGSFACSVTVTGAASSTPYTLSATGSDGSFDSAAATFMITAPSIVLSPTQGPSGVAVSVSGDGFTPGATVFATVGTGATVSDCGATVSSTGAFDCSITISGTASTSAYTVRLAGSDGSYDNATATYLITTPTITLTPAQGPSGAQTTIAGAGFTPGRTVSSSVSASATVTGCGAVVSLSGTFSCSVTVSSAAAALYTITATGSDAGTDLAHATFTITTPSVVLAPGQGPTGIVATLTGSGFTPEVTVAAAIGAGASVTDCGATVSGTGTFQCSVTINGSASSTAYRLTASGSDGSFDNASAPFTITTPAIALLPALGPSGASTTVTGTGFTPGADVTTTIGSGATISSCGGATSGSGSFSCTVTIDSGTPVGYSVTATGSDGGNDRANATFKVTEPGIALTPAQGPSGDTVIAIGTGFTPGATITVSISSGATVSSCGATVSPEGTFSCSMMVTSSAPATYTLLATGSDGTFDSASALLTVTLPAVAISPMQAPVGGAFTVTGSGFTVSSPVTVSLGDPVLTPSACTQGTISGSSIITNATGGFACTFQVPSGTSGSLPVVVMDEATGTETRSPSAFTVTSSPAPFPWWIVGLAVVVVVVAVLGVLLVTRRQRRTGPRAPGRAPVAPPPAWQETPSPVLGPGALAPEGPAEPAYLETGPSLAPPEMVAAAMRAVPVVRPEESALPPGRPSGEGEPEPDIDLLLDELARIRTEMDKLARVRGEIAERAAKKGPEAATDASTPDTTGSAGS